MRPDARFERPRAPDYPDASAAQLTKLDIAPATGPAAAKDIYLFSARDIFHILLLAACYSSDHLRRSGQRQGRRR